jgi:hypothetical protein
MSSEGKKVIFLDHDGVICLSTEWGGRYKKQRAHFTEENPRKGAEDGPVEVRFDNFNKKAISTLNQILEETGADIVVSSDWKRWANVEEMGDYYTQQGIIKRPIAFTKNLNECTWHNEKVFVWSPKYDLEQCRAIEIRQYLIDDPEVTHWVAIDDLNMGIEIKDGDWGMMKRDWGLSNFVFTPKSIEGIKQSGIKEKIIHFLNKQ